MTAGGIAKKSESREEAKCRSAMTAGGIAKKSESREEAKVPERVT